MKSIQQNWIEIIKDKDFIKSTILSFIFLLVSMFINFYAGTYATERASLPVTDIILSNIRVFDVDVIFNYAPIFLIIFVVIISFYKPKRIPFVAKSVALFTVIRSIFISLTHIGPFPIQAISESGNIMSKLTFGGDLFFSGHTGIPFLLALIFWQNKNLRYFFLVYSVFMGTVVLLGHYHYSIDVLAAFFITYTIFHISSYLFKRDKDMMENN